MDLLILDINIPMRVDSPPKRNGGISLLNKISRDPIIKRPSHIVGLTEYNDILEEMLYYCTKYEEHIRLYKMKLKHGVLETLLMIPAEMVEGVIRLKPTKIVKALFTFKRQKVELLEQEKKAPGRDLAYLFKSKDEFGN